MRSSRRRTRRLARSIARLTATFAISAAAHVLITHSSFFTDRTQADADAVALKQALANAPAGIEPVARLRGDAARGARRLALDRTAGVARDVDAPADLSSIALELSRRAIGASYDVPCSTTVAPPLAH